MWEKGIHAKCFMGNFFGGEMKISDYPVICVVNHVSMCKLAPLMFLFSKYAK